MKLDILTSVSLIDGFEALVRRLSGTNEKHIIIVPDHFALSAEKLLFEILNVPVLFNIDVMTMSRYASSKMNMNNYNIINAEKSVMLVNKILLEKKDFKVFSKSNTNAFARNLYNTINLLKSCNVSAEQLKQNVDNNNLLLKNKLEDISSVYSEYEKNISEQSLDSAKKFEEFIKCIQSIDDISATNFHFAMFDSFTSQFYRIINKFIQNAKSVTISVATSFKQNNSFLYDNEQYFNLLKIANNLHIEAKTINVNFQAKDCFKFLANNLYDYNLKNSFTLTDNSISLFCADNKVDEIENVARIINSGILKNKSRFSDYVIILPNMENYRTIIEQVFGCCGINFYLDYSENLVNHFYVKFILNVLQTIQGNYTQSDIINLSKSIFVGLDLDEQSKFENFIFRYNIDKNCFKNLKKFDFDDNFEEFFKISQFLNKIFDLNINVNNDINFENLVNVLYKIIDVFDMKNVLNNFIEILKNSNQFEVVKFSEMVEEKFDNFIQNSLSILSKTKTKLSNFLDIISSGLSMVKLNLIPTTIDSVQVLEESNAIIPKYKNVFVVGSSDGHFPSQKSDTSILTDNDIVSMKKSDIITPNINKANFLSRFNTFNILLSASERLIVSYAEDDDGVEKKPCEMMTLLSNTFNVKNDDNIVPLPIFKINNRLLLASTLSEFDRQRLLTNYFQTPEFASKKLLYFDRYQKNNISFIGSKYLNTLSKVLIDLKCSPTIHNTNLTKSNISCGKELFLSNATKVSQIESFYTCPYKHFVDYGLKLKTRETIDLRAIDVGIILHAVSQKFVDYYINNNNVKVEDLKVISDKIFSEIINQKQYIPLVKVANKNQIKLLNQEANRLCVGIFEQLQMSDFVPKFTEKYFSLKLKDLGIDDPQICDLKLNGIIDRIDECGDLIKIIDYKTGSTSFSYKDIFSGKKLQLFLYSIIASKLTNKFVGASVYFNIKSKLTNDYNSSFYTLDGVSIDNLDIIQKLDNTLSRENLESKFMKIKLKVDKSNNLVVQNNSTIITCEEYSQIENYCLNLIKNALKLMLSGYIEDTPYFSGTNKGVCDYCDYQCFCKHSLLKPNIARTISERVTAKDFGGDKC